MKIRLRRLVCVGQSLVPGNAVTFWEREVELPIVPRRRDWIHLAPDQESHKVIAVELYAWDAPPRVWVRAADELDVDDFEGACARMHGEGWTCVEAHDVERDGWEIRPLRGAQIRTGDGRIVEE